MIWNPWTLEISIEANRNWRTATTPPRRDPLAIDLDGDGIETVGIPSSGNPILFDHDADGTKTGTGWLKGDDAWLVLDRDGNGAVDSGRELFGVDTLITVTEAAYPGGPLQTVTRNARSGFEALRALDTGSGVAGPAGFGDGVFDAHDAAFAEVRLWRDLNQDGVSQNAELLTLAQQGITSISLNASTSTTNLGNGNTVTGQATVARSNGSTTNIDGVDLQASNLNLADNPFYRQFSDHVALSEAAIALPEMGGSGWLRDLREAMSLPDNASSTALTEAVAGFASAGTRDAQLAGLDAIIDDWARSSGRVDSGWLRPMTATVLSATTLSSTQVQRTVRWTAMDPANYPDPASTLIPCATFQLPAQYYETVLQAGVPVQVLTAAGREVMRRLGDLEAFNGQRFMNVTVTETIGTGGSGAGSGGTGTGGAAQTVGYETRWTISLAAQQVDAINAAYGALSESIYSGLVTQTRLKPYLDAVSLTIGDNGISFDTAPLTTLLDANQSTDPRNALIDLVELNRYVQPTLQALNFDGIAKLRSWVDALPAGSASRTELLGLDVLGASATAGSTRGDIYLGDSGANTFNAGNGDDLLDGGAGSDQLVGGNGNDSLEGGAGNDLLVGGIDNGNWNGSNYYNGAGDDTYRFGRGDGQDTVWDVDSTAGNLDTISLKEGVAASDVRITRPAGTNNLILSIVGTTDTLTVVNFFAGDGSGGYAIEQITFADGTSWDLAAIKAQALLSTAGADDITGYASDDPIDAGDGNDRVWARAGNDVVQAGAGNDTLWGEDGNDVLSGGDGADMVFAGNGNDVIEGGAGNDLLVGGIDNGNWNGSNYYNGAGSDTYRFGRGDGQDTIWDVDGTAGNLDTIALKEGVAPSDVRITRPAGSNNLILSIGGTTDSVTVANFFVGDGGGYAIEQMTFADGTVWNLAAIKAQALLSTANADAITGYASDDQINAGDGNDRVWARAGNDVVQAGAGNDQLWGEDGNDSLDGGDGADALFAGTGNDTLEGGTGNDLLVGGIDNGNWNGSNYYDGAGNDTYRFGRGDGQDTVWDVDATAGNLDSIALKAGVAPVDVRITRPAGTNNLILSIVGTTDTLTVANFFVGDGSGGYAIEQMTFADGTVWDLATIRTKALTVGATANADDLTGYAFDDYIDGQAGNDRIWGRGGDDLLVGGAGNDTLWGEDGNDFLNGGDGADALFAGMGNDVIEGGAGNDVLVGGIDNGNWNGSNYYNGAGNDTYRFGRGDGQDTVWDVDSAAGNLDTISLKDGVAPSDVRITRPAGTNNLILSIVGSTDTLTVVNFFVGDGSGGYAIEQMTFADGTVWDLAAMKAQALLATTGADDITGYASDDQINAGDGNDRIWARAGNDVVQGGAGNDQLWGEDGNDVLSGGDGTDTVYAGNGNDVIEGGAGNDLLVGGNDNGNWNGSNYYNGAGNDTYRFGRGDGQDTIWDVDSTVGNLDTISLKEGVAASDVRITRPAGTNNLILSIVGTTDTLTVANFFVGDGSGGYAIEQMTFADGTSWDLAAIKAQALLSTAGADDITGYASDDQINAGDGNDRVWARAGNDVVSGGAGNDRLWGEDGNDVLTGGDGADTAFAGNGNDIVDGGAGNDLLVGGIDNGNWNGSNYYNGSGNDTYRFGRGDGQDTVWDVDSATGNRDTISLKEGVAASDVRITRPAGTNNLILSIAGTTDSVTVANFFAGDGSGGYAIEQITFADGTGWDLAAIKAQALLSTAGTDDIIGYASDDQINAGDGNDRVWARAGSDSLSGGAGNDTLWGEDGNDSLNGDDGADALFAGTGNDTLEGGAGNDLLVGGIDNGNWNGSNYYNGAGNDTYRFGRGDGQDTIWDVDSAAGNLDTIALKAGVAPSDVRITRPAGSSNLILSIVGTTDSVTVANFFVGDGSGGYAIEQIIFTDGTSWDLAAIKAQALLSTAGADEITGYASDDQVNAGDGNDRIWARAGNDTVQAGAGTDTLWGDEGNDSLNGGDGADALFGGIGNDVIDGDTGNDLLVGGIDNGNWNGSNYYNGAGNDTYRFGRGGGQDTVWDVDSTAGNLDTINLKDGVAPGDARIARPAGSNNLILSVVGTTDTLTVANFFAGDGSGGYAIEQITFADGTIWDLAAIKAQALLSTAGADDITGYASDDQVNAGDGNDRIWARAGNDSVQAGAGNDQLWGEDGNDVLSGGDGTDTVYAGNGNDVIEGGAGNDLLVGGVDNGNWNGSNYYNGAGSDTYRFGRGDGQDTVWDVDGTAGNLDTIALKEGVAPSDVRITRPAGSNNLILSIGGTTDSVTVANFFVGDGGGGYAIEQMAFADGTVWDLAAIKAQALLSTANADDITGYASDDQINAGDGNDRVWARAGNDVVSGGAGNDQLWGEDGNDVLTGGDGADTVFAGNGNDIIEGGAGNDLLVGGIDNGNWNGSNYYNGAGNDTYRCGRGDGQDTVWDVDSTAGNVDVLSFLSNISTEQLWFRQVGSALEVSIIGTDDRVQVANWFAGASYHVENFKTADGHTLLDSNVQNLVNAMAGFAPPSIGQTTLPANYQSTLLPTISSSWASG